MRVGCLLAPDLPLAARLRAEPERAGLPLAVVSEAGPRAVVVAASPEARRAGIVPGLSAGHARAVCAGLHVCLPAPALEHTARHALLDAACSVAARVEAAPPAGGPARAEAAVFLEASGADALFGSEQGLARALVARAGNVGLPAVVAVAGTRRLARLAARRLAATGRRGEVLCIAPGEERAFLAPLPVDLLDPDDALTDLMTRLGIHRMETLLALPRRTTATRLGARCARLVAELLGEVPEPPLARSPDAPLEEAVDLEAPVERLEPLTFVLRALLSRLLARLEMRRLACSALHLTATLACGRSESWRVGLAAPTLDARVALRRLRFALEGQPPPDAVEAVHLAAKASPLRGDQLDLFRPAGPAPAVLDALIAELEALCGPGRVGAPQVPDDARPDAFALAPYRPPDADARQQALPDPPNPSVLALRALRPPVPARVRERAGRPLAVRSAIANGDVVRCAGPWRTSGGWWSPQTRFAFDHFDAWTSDGLLVRLRRDLVHREWHVDGIYD